MMHCCFPNRSLMELEGNLLSIEVDVEHFSSTVYVEDVLFGEEAIPCYLENLLLSLQSTIPALCSLICLPTARFIFPRPYPASSPGWPQLGTGCCGRGACSCISWCSSCPLATLHRPEAIQYICSRIKNYLLALGCLLPGLPLLSVLTSQSFQVS